MRKRMFIGTSMILSTMGFLLTSQGAAGQGGAEFSKDIQFLFLAGMVVSIGLGLFVLITMAYFLIRYRENTKAVRNRIKNEMKLEIAWTLVALVLVGIAFVLTVPVLSGIIATPSEGFDDTVMIEARQFGWRFYYKNVPNGNQTGDIFTDNSGKYAGFGYVSVKALYLEVGKTYLLNVTSLDVIHSFYVYDLSFKIDAVPGTYNLFKLKIVEPGEYQVKCAEYCGASHYNMYSEIVAFSSSS